MPKTEKPENFDAMSAAEVADLLGVTDKTVRNWMNTGGLPFHDSGRMRLLNWHEALKWYVNYRITDSGNGGNEPVKSGDDPAPVVPPENYEAALARKTRAEADLKELELSTRRGQVAAIGDVELALSRSNKETQTRILALPSRLAPQLVGRDEQTEVFGIIQLECNQILSSLANVDCFGVSDEVRSGEPSPEIFRSSVSTGATSKEPSWAICGIE